MYNFIRDIGPGQIVPVVEIHAKPLLTALVRSQLGLTVEHPATPEHFHSRHQSLGPYVCA